MTDSATPRSLSLAERQAQGLESIERRDWVNCGFQYVELNAACSSINFVWVLGLYFIPVGVIKTAGEIA
jgi:hypothetical protein